MKNWQTSAFSPETGLQTRLRFATARAQAVSGRRKNGLGTTVDASASFPEKPGTTQGDPLAMAMYAIVITPLIHRLEDRVNKQVWFADDATAGGNLDRLKTWWDRISEIGPDYGYYPNSSKTWLIVKDSNLEEAKTLFQGTGVSITAEGKRHLGAAIGTNSFVESYVKRKVSVWVHEVEHLSSIAVTQPHAAYAAFTHGQTSKWTYLSRTIPDIGDLLKPVENAIRQRFCHLSQAKMPSMMLIGT